MTVSSTAVSFSDDFSNTDLFLVEADEDLLSELFNGTGKIKGLNDCVLTTSSKTYSMKWHDNSNTQYILQNSSTILAETKSIIKLELLNKPSVPLELLEHENLLEIVPASDQQAIEYLIDHPEVLSSKNSNLFVRIDPRRKIEVTKSVLLAAFASSAGGVVDLEQVWLDLGDDLTVAQTAGLLDKIANQMNPKKFMLDSEKIKSFLLEEIVRCDDEGHPLLYLVLQTWKSHVSQFLTDEDTDDLTEEALLCYGKFKFVLNHETLCLHICDLATLSSEPRSRLNELFKVKPRWLRNELIDYLTPAFGKTEGIDAWLLKNSRLIQVGDNRMYVSLF
jgi:Sister chromatid cohesion protein Dcc1